ncbi:hypothetical protein EVAR_16858_1 [Eumeta japonica]|uniref:Uncharacterized protein n=1 Tax=Eumeta variegata TaxID=151549 RepID=A0A4C1V3A0_EUMVA|nr:hypothetical protein EVAR_16858_1 [Eumeta japonica]
MTSRYNSDEQIEMSLSQTDRLGSVTQIRRATEPSAREPARARCLFGHSILLLSRVRGTKATASGGKPTSRPERVGDQRCPWTRVMAEESPVRCRSLGTCDGGENGPLKAGGTLVTPLQLRSWTAVITHTPMARIPY